MNPATDTATPEDGMQDIADRLEKVMFDSRDAAEDSLSDEPTETDDEVSEDAPELPKDDDSDSEDEGSDKDLDEIADDELTLADYLGIDDDRVVELDDGSYAFNAIIDGEHKQVPLTDLVADYQLKSHVNNKSVALENERKELEQAKTTAAQEITQRVDGLEALGKMMEEEVVEQYNSVDWERLRTENPAEWTALRQQFAERAQKVQKAQSLVSEERERVQQEQQEAWLKEYQEHLSREMSAMIAAKPEWADDSVRSRDMAEVRTFLSNTYGFADEDMKTVSDHRLINLILDAKAFREGKAGADKKRSEKKLPKFQKPGASKPNAKQLAKARGVKAKRDQLRKSGSVKDAAALLIDRM